MLVAAAVAVVVVAAVDSADRERLLLGVAAV